MMFPSEGFFFNQALNPLLAHPEDKGYHIFPKNFLAHSEARPVRDKTLNPFSAEDRGGP